MQRCYRRREIQYVDPPDFSTVASHVTFQRPISSCHRKAEEQKPMKRTFAVIVGALAAAALFGGLVYAVLVATHVSVPAATTVYGMTPRRLWATTAAGLALIGVVIGALAGRLGAVIAVTAGLIAVVNGGLNLAVANGGPGTGNGVVGGAAAFVLGLVGLSLGGLALVRWRRTASEPGRTT
jgi:hypothetical protein